MRNRALTLLSVLLAALSLSIAAPAAQADTTSIAVNTKDNSTLVSIVFDIERILGKTVDTGNAAVAIASCTSCNTVAIAFQIVLAAETPNVVIPQNVAAAANVRCSSCKTFALAFQYVYAGGPAQLTKRGLQEILRIRSEVLALQTSGLPVEEIVARALALNQQLVNVLNTQIVPANQQGDNQTDAVNLPGTSRAGDGTRTYTGPIPGDTGTQTTPAGTGTTTTPTGTGTTTTPSGTGTTTTPTGPTGPTGTTP